VWQRPNPSIPDRDRDVWGHARQPHRGGGAAQRLHAQGGHPSATDVNSNIRDRRTWARGINLSAQGNGAADLSTTSITFVDPTNTLDFRLECSGVALVVTFSGHVQNDVAGNATLVALLMDGAEITRANVTCPAAGTPYPYSWKRTFVPAAGSHLYTVGLATLGAGTATLKNVSPLVPHIEYVEKLAQNTQNNAVTSG
jgi:hypothetical protein